LSLAEFCEQTYFFCSTINLFSLVFDSIGFAKFGNKIVLCQKEKEKWQTLYIIDKWLNEKRKRGKNRVSKAVINFWHFIWIEFHHNHMYHSKDDIFGMGWNLMFHRFTFIMDLFNLVGKFFWVQKSNSLPKQRKLSPKKI
jgi:hypothetical protein